MKRKLLWQFSVIMVVAALLTSTVASAAPATGQKVVFPPEYHQPGPGWRSASVPQAAVPGNGSVNAQAIALGKPGTAFGLDKTFGIPTVGYLPDDPAGPVHLNGVAALKTEADGSVYAVEESGARLIKFNAAGEIEWTVGGSGFHDWGSNGLNWPRDVMAFAGIALVADQDIVTGFTTDTGEWYLRFPFYPWEATDDYRFGEMRGITIDPYNHIYVADSGRNRVQVYTLTGTGEINYSMTIGITDEPGDDNNHFNRPAQIEFINDSLYVTDVMNFRVQKCDPDAVFSAFTCTTFYGGEQGDQAGQLNYAYGLGMDGGGNLYIADSGNGRVLRCPMDGSSTTCTEYLQGLNWPADIAFRLNVPDGNALVSVYDDFTIQEFAPDGTYVGLFSGVSGVPYLTDTFHYDMPSGVDVDTKGNVYIAEQGGARLSKLSSAGTVLWQSGKPGNPWGPPETNVSSAQSLAVDKTGKLLYVAGGSNVRIYSAVNGVYLSKFDEGWGEGPKQFKDARGIAFDSTGAFYIADAENQRVVKYDKFGVRLYQLGITGEPGLDNAHFAWPSGVATDKTGNVYVADREACRVQKFSKTGLFLATIGTAMCGDTHDRMAGPTSVVVDSKGNIYVGQEWSNRINVYASTGAYLTTIAGAWGALSGEMRSPSDLAVDSKGALYVADRGNNRVEKFLPTTPNFGQISLNGFGNRQNAGVSSLATFKGVLFAGTAQQGPGGEVWKLNKSTGWEKVIDDGFEQPGNTNISSMVEYKGYLYAGTFNCQGTDCVDSSGGQVWRTQDGYTWMPVTLDGFGRAGNSEILHLRTINLGLGMNLICAQTADWFAGSGAEIWCSETGDRYTWAPLGMGGFGDSNNVSSGGWLFFNNAVYIGTGNTATGGQVMRYDGEWQKVNDDGFGDAGNTFIRDLALYKGYIYASTENIEGPELWRCLATTECNEQADWSKVGTIGLGSPASSSIDALRISKGVLYAFTRAYIKAETPDGIQALDTLGLEVFKSLDGVNWMQVGRTGMGSSLNEGLFWDNSIVQLSTGDFYLGIYDYLNPVNGGAVWKFCPTKTVCK